MNAAQAADPETRVRRRLLAAAPLLAGFDPDDYRGLNADLAEVDPWEHFVDFGAWEGRAATTPERLTARLARAAALAPRPDPSWSQADLADGFRLAADLQAAIHLPRAASAQTRALAERLSDLLADVGAGVRVLEGPPSGAGGAEARLVLDPVGLFGGGRPQGEALEALEVSVVAFTDAAGDAGFAATLPYALAARGVACREGSAYALIAHAGRPAVWLGAPPRDPAAAAAPPDHPLIAGLSRVARAAPSGLPLAERPIDLAALEDATFARTSAWERMADGLADSDLALVVRRPADADAHLPHEAAARAFVYARSKLVLHLHAAAPAAPRDAVLAETADAGAALVCEPSPAHLLARPGVALRETSARRAPALARHLAADPQGLAEAAACAQALRATLARAFAPDRTALALVRLLASAPPERSRP